MLRPCRMRRGEADRVPLVRVIHHVLQPPQRTARAEGRASLVVCVRLLLRLSLRSPLVRRFGAKPARSGCRHRHARAGLAQSEHRRHRRDRRRHGPQHDRRFGRGPAASRGRHAARAQRRTGPDLRVFHSRRQHQSDGAPDRRRARRLGFGRPGRVRGAEPGADRPHRGAARAGVEPLRRRRRRRRGADLHAQRRRQTARHRPRRDRRLPLAAGRTRRRRVTESASACSRRI